MVSLLKYCHLPPLLILKSKLRELIENRKKSRLPQFHQTHLCTEYENFVGYGPMIYGISDVSFSELRTRARHQGNVLRILCDCVLSTRFDGTVTRPNRFHTIPSVVDSAGKVRRWWRNGSEVRMIRGKMDLKCCQLSLLSSWDLLLRAISTPHRLCTSNYSCLKRRSILVSNIYHLCGRSEKSRKVTPKPLNARSPRSLLPPSDENPNTNNA